MAKRSKDIDAIIAATPGWRGATLAKLRAIVHQADPGMTEAAKWKKPSNPLGAAVFEHDGIVCIGIVLKERVRLAFAQGARLPDPKELFNAQLEGNQSRAIDFREGDALNAPALKALVRAGVARNRAKAKAGPGKPTRTTSKPENKTKPTDASVEDYIASRGNAQQQADCRALMAMFRRITRKPPRMWGPSIVGHGSLRYTTKGGRTGEMPKAAFAIRGRDLVVYISAEGPSQRALLPKVGKHSIGKSCLYFRRLADLDQAVLEQLVVGSIAEARHPHR